MKKSLLPLLSLGGAWSAWAVEEFKGPIDLSYNTQIYGKPMIEAIPTWGSGGILGMGEIGGIGGLGQLFTFLQNGYFAMIFLAIIIAVPLVFLLHYLVVGPKRFSHDDKRIKVFNRFNIFIHWAAGVPFVLLCITGLLMVFGDKLGGGAFIRFARDVHGVATLFFALFGPFMFIMWVKHALFKLYDIQWMLILGGYLSKVKRPVPAGKFNAGQKMWFWVCTVGGFFMVYSGYVMFFQDGNIETLRLMAILHNVLGFAIVALLMTHIYMAAFAIEGALHSMLDGHMGEEEIAILHSYYYKELQAEGKA